MWIIGFNGENLAIEYFACKNVATINLIGR